MSKRDLKKDHILEAGLAVMEAHGYNGTSVKDIVEAAGVPKGSFYNYFDSKEAFAVEAIERAAQANLEECRRQLTRADQPPRERLLNFFDQQINGCCDNEFQVGCFLGNMCQEMADSSELIRDKLRQVLDDQTQLFETALDEAKAEGHLAPDTDTASLAEFVFNAWEGAMMRMKAAKCRHPLDAFFSQMGQLLRR